ncbi:MBL fold metallo-hydrolase [Pseudorhodoplanes sp.]|uniref:MBL fold metallo-hydrolase n=1 Tax=Pseudorhodoplanes sp. TaxID=1934341 RepID=UPI002C321D22|nr:MBL fold metallo-hydrolase [Pseudorhodoplanes sp.]HWV53299.1 MBL fold metallo-hydrolase [Pseudorhodoplanes sp.]
MIFGSHSNAFALSRCVAAGLAALGFMVAGSLPGHAQSNTAQITIIYDAFGKPSNLKKDWGFGALIEYGGKRILFDTGNNAEVFAHNVKEKGIDLTTLDFAIVSHRHGDHTSGLNHLVKVNPKLQIYTPQENFGVFGAAFPGSFFRRDESLPADMRYYEGKAPQTVRFGSAWPEGNFTWVTKTTEIAPGIHLILLNGLWGVDLEVKEISLAIETPDGIVLVVGCSHPTIEKIVEATKTATNKPIHLVVGGTHLLPAKDDQIRSIASTLRDKLEVRYIAPAHCTGEPAFAILKEAFGDRYVYAGLGATLVLGSKVTVRADAGEPQKYAMDESDIRTYRQAMVQGPYRALLGSAGGPAAQRSQ